MFHTQSSCVSAMATLVMFIFVFAIVTPFAFALAFADFSDAVAVGPDFLSCASGRRIWKTQGFRNPSV